MSPVDGERAQLDALHRQASAFADYVSGQPCRGATVDDAIAALEAAANATRQISMMDR